MFWGLMSRWRIGTSWARCSAPALGGEAAVEHGDDVRVLRHDAHRPALPLEGRPAVDPVVGHGEDLHRHHPVELALVGLVHAAVAPRRPVAEALVVRDRDGHRWPHPLSTRTWPRRRRRAEGLRQRLPHITLRYSAQPVGPADAAVGHPTRRSISTMGRPGLTSEEIDRRSVGKEMVGPLASPSPRRVRFVPTHTTGRTTR